MYIIDETYMTIGRLLIPNINEQQDTSVKTKVIYYIDRMSRLIFKSSLGEVSFADFDSNVTDGVLDDGAPQKWKDLVNGTSYTYEGKEYYWKGMIEVEGTNKNSLLANYTFYKYAIDNMTITTDSGRVLLTVKNSKNVNSDDYLRPIWNDFARSYRGDIKDYKRVDNFECYNNTRSYKSDQYKDKTNNVSLIKFLEHNSVDYPDAAMSLVIDQEMIKVKNWANI